MEKGTYNVWLSSGKFILAPGDPMSPTHPYFLKYVGDCDDDSDETIKPDLFLTLFEVHSPNRSNKKSYRLEVAFIETDGSLFKSALLIDHISMLNMAIINEAHLGLSPTILEQLNYCYDKNMRVAYERRYA